MRIRASDQWIRIRILLFKSLTFKRPTKYWFKKKFCLLLFENTFTSFFRDKKSKESHKTVGIKVFLSIFAGWSKDPDPYIWLADPDSGGPKTYGSYGSGTQVYLIRNSQASHCCLFHHRLQHHHCHHRRTPGQDGPAHRPDPPGDGDQRFIASYKQYRCV